MTALVLMLVVLAGCATAPNAPPPADPVASPSLRAPDPPMPAVDGAAEPHDAALTKLESENRALRQRLRDLETELDGVRRDIARLAVEARATLEAARTPVMALVSRPAPAAPVAAERLYVEALSHVRARRYAEGVMRLSDLLHRFPSHALAPNAQYWIGEARYGEGQYTQAVVEFEKVLARTDGGHKAPDALLMIGQAYRNLGDASRAWVALRRLLDRYPESDAARVGRRLLQTAR